MGLSPRIRLLRCSNRRSKQVNWSTEPSNKFERSLICCTRPFSTKWAWSRHCDGSSKAYPIEVGLKSFLRLSRPICHECDRSLKPPFSASCKRRSPTCSDIRERETESSGWSKGRERYSSRCVTTGRVLKNKSFSCVLRALELVLAECGSESLSWVGACVLRMPILVRSWRL